MVGGRLYEEYQRGEGAKAKPSKPPQVLGADKGFDRELPTRRMAEPPPPHPLGEHLGLYEVHSPAEFTGVEGKTKQTAAGFGGGQGV